MTGTPVHLFALVSIALSGAGCSFAMVRPTPRENRCNTLLGPILDGSAGALAVLLAVDSARSPVRPDCPVDDLSCYTTSANRQSDVEAWGGIAAAFAASTIYGLGARYACREALVTPLEPPIIPGAVLGPAAESTAGVESTAPAPPAAAPMPAMPEEAEPTAPGPAVEPPPRKRGKTYVAAWLGYGGEGIDWRHEEIWFQPVLALPIPQSVGIGFGLPVGRRLLAGAEWNVSFGINCWASMNEADGACDRAVALQQLLATATWYPLWDGPMEAPPRGPLVRGGAGGALLNTWFWPDDTSSRTERTSRAGAGVLVGLGYAVGGRSPRTLDGGVDFTWQWYGSSALEPERSFAFALRLGMTFH